MSREMIMCTTASQAKLKWIRRAGGPNSITTCSTFQKTTRNFAKQHPFELIFSFRDRAIDALHFWRIFFEN